MPTRQESYAVLDSSRKELRQSIAGLTDEQLTAPAVDGWSVKDMLAHITSWEEMMAQDFRRAARGHMPALMHHSPAHTDDLNNLIMSMRRDFPLQQVLMELDATRQDMMKALDDVPDESFEKGFVSAFLAICGRHDEEHSQLIDKWRKEAGI